MSRRTYTTMAAIPSALRQTRGATTATSRALTQYARTESANDELWRAVRSLWAAVRRLERAAGKARRG